MSSPGPAYNIYLSLLLLLAACSNTGKAPGPEPCSQVWFSMIESQVGSGDGHGHGPDPGSDEWKSVIEFRLGIRGDPSVPDRNSDEWCRFINHQASKDN